jgi:hypothetical protein
VRDGKASVVATRGAGGPQFTLRVRVNSPAFNARSPREVLAFGAVSSAVYQRGTARLELTEAEGVLLSGCGAAPACAT